MEDIFSLFTTEEQEQIIDCFEQNERENNWSFMCARDLFSLGCFLLIAGKPEAGRKACDAALKAMLLPGNIPDKVLAYLQGREKDWGLFFKPHLEIGRVIDQL